MQTAGSCHRPAPGVAEPVRGAPPGSTGAATGSTGAATSQGNPNGLLGGSMLAAGTLAAATGDAIVSAAAVAGSDPVREELKDPRAVAAVPSVRSQTDPTMVHLKAR